jgi:hypothetical protein
VPVSRPFSTPETASTGAPLPRPRCARPGTGLGAAGMPVRHEQGTTRSSTALRPRFVHSVGTRLWTKGFPLLRLSTPPPPTGWTQDVEKPVDNGGQPGPSMWTGGACPVHDAGRRGGQDSSVHDASPASRRVLDSSSTGHSRSDQRRYAMSPGSTGVKTRNELRTLRMGSPPTSTRPTPDPGRDRRTGRPRRQVHDRPPPRVLSCGRSGRSRPDRPPRGGDPTRRAAPSEVPRRT